MYSALSYSIIPNQLYTVLFASFQLELHPPDWWVSHPLNGYFTATLKYKDHNDQGKIYVAQKGVTILGWNHQRDFQMILDPNGTEPVIQIEDRLQPRIISDFPEAFIDSTGIAKKFKHMIQLKNNAVTVQHKV